MLQIKRAYVPFSSSDGYRVLIDRLWPRGVKRDSLAIDEWAKDLAPSHELRRFFGHAPALWSAFKQRYRAELRRKDAAILLETLARRSLGQTVTLVYAAKDELHNDAVVLKQVIERLAKRSPKNRRQVGKKTRPTG